MMRLVLLAILFAACGERGRLPTAPPAVVGKEDLIEENRKWQQRESREIDLWVRRQGMTFVTSGTGVRLSILRDVPGDTARPDDLARVSYRLSLLNGDTCYATPQGAPESFRIEHDDVESGLHEAIQHLSEGDSAVVVIPSHRAHGLVGDQEKVPMRSPVVYHIALLKLTPPRP